MTFFQAEAFLNSRISMGWKLGLHSMQQMMHELGNPQLRCRFVHIAGTNGKGSVAAMLESIFRAAGYKTGLYTSPHLLSVRERIRVEAEDILENAFADLLQRIKPVVETYNATYFETLTALAFVYFAEMETDIVLLEVGLGGRLDATNIVLPELCIINSISYDHTKHLGTTLAEIAREKAGIIKPNVPCLIGDLPTEAQQIIAQTCHDKNSALFSVLEMCQPTERQQELGAERFQVKGTEAFDARYELLLNGEHQITNACVAIAACELLVKKEWNLSVQDIRSGLRGCRWPGRFQIVRHHPMVILDVAHNEASINFLARLLKHFFADRQIIFVFGVLEDKNVKKMCSILAPLANCFQPVAAQNPRALSAQNVFDCCKRFTPSVLPASTVSKGIDAAFSIANEQSVICITGSHYVVGEAIKCLTN